jgi:hypothetical protein
MATISWLADVLRAERLPVVEEGDWQNRAAPGTFSPIGVLWHHTAAFASSSDPAPSLDIVINGRPDLSGPLCHALLDYNGVFHIIAAGRANHAGASGGSGPIPAGDGNTMLIGWEIDYAGDQSGATDQAISALQYSAAVRGTAAVLRRLGKDASYARGHRETSTTGKIDPSFVDLDQMRAAVARELAGGGSAAPLVGDWNGDGRADVGVYRPSSHRWLVPNFLDNAWGGARDIPVPGMWNGNGRTYQGVWRPATGEWLIPGVTTHRWGGAGDIPVPADYNGDGKTDIAVYRPSAGRYLIPGMSSAALPVLPDAVPVPGDYDGDGKAEQVVYSRGTWYFPDGRTSRWGAAGDIPVPGDWNGDGRTNVGVWRPSTGRWLVPGYLDDAWGGAGDVPVPMHWNGGSRVYIGVFRPATGEWLVPGRATVRWGGSGDVPIAASGNYATWRQLGLLP